MKVKEAIEHCDEIIKKMDNCECRKEHEELKEFLEELQKYRDTGLTSEQVMELKERDKPRKIELNAGVPICPVCGRRVVRCYDFCPDCGHRLEQ